MTAALSPIKRPGMFEAAVQKLFARSVNVLEAVDIGSTFRLITLGGDALRDVAWTPGDKIQMQLGGWVQRTYTPIDWDAIHGRTRILVHLAADGPGTQWARRVRPGDVGVVFGPRTSIQVAPASAPTILFGDETSIGLAAALVHHGLAPAVHVLLEVAAPADTLEVLAHLRVDGVHLCTRRAGDAHVAELEANLSALLMLDAASDIVLTGKASTLQRMTRFLKQTGIGAGKRHTKAYWAAGKTGLD